MKRCQHLALIIDGLNKELFNIKESISVNLFIDQLFEWIIVNDECYFNVNEEKKLVDNIKKTLNKCSEELFDFISGRTKNKYTSKNDENELIDTLKLEQDRWDDYTEE